jgi:acetyl-CoA carboxylase biotin carboxyl carrier protein
MSIDIELQTSGNIWKVLVEKNQAVSEGSDLFIMEVMKMEVPHTAPCDGLISAINITEGDEGLDAGMVAVSITPTN